MKFTFNQKLIGLVFVHIGILTYAMITDFSWWYLLFGYLFAKLANMLGHEIGMHRLWSHNSFKTTKLKEYILHAFAFPMLFGSTIVYAAVHRDHHKYADTPKDPHREGLMDKLFYVRDQGYQIKPRSVYDLVKDPTHKFLHDNYLKLNTLILVLVLVLLGPVVTGWTLSFVIVYMWIGGLTVNTLGHDPSKGYRNFETDDKSTNNYFLQFVFPGVGLHNNHHAHPGKYRLSMAKGEHDFPAWIIEHFLIDNQNKLSKKEEE